MLLYRVPAILCCVMAVAHELMGGPVVAESLSKGSLFASSMWDEMTWSPGEVAFVLNTCFHTCGAMVAITAWVFWQAAAATGPASHALTKIAIALSATTFVCAVALGVTSPDSHGTFAWTTPPIYAWSLTTGMGLVGLATDNRRAKKE
ncbi:hypothetical protein TrST_g13238 [Triparma strigata]|uniref:DUF998 domain-containing protein n=1 Tax=Triparma strigata TaxID=1606541 RepID=A0A9W7EPF2_9STRA|nr:hypothetical protein TrST_g13238 [Triparma strigata]